MLDVIDMCGWMRKEVVKRRKNPGSGILLKVGDGRELGLRTDRLMLILVLL